MPGEDPAGESGAKSFRGLLYELPSNYAHILNVAMDVPVEVSQAFGSRGPVPVIGSADGCRLQATLVPVGNGRHRLFLNQEVRRMIGKGAGDDVEITIQLDGSDRMPTVPDDLEAALRHNDALAAWAALRPSRRKECLVALADAKTAKTRGKRIARIVDAAIDEGSPRIQE